MRTSMQGASKVWMLWLLLWMLKLRWARNLSSLGTRSSLMLWMLWNLCYNLWKSPMVQAWTILWMLRQSQVGPRSLSWHKLGRYCVCFIRTSLSKATLLHGYRLEVPNCLVNIAIDLFDTVNASKSKINHLMQIVVSFNFNQVQVLP